MLHGQLRYNVASRFVNEMPSGAVLWLSERRRPAMAVARPQPPALHARVLSDLEGWRIGQSVKHAKFGLGIIVDAEGRGTDARVQVNFREAGVKWLALEYAKLQPA